MLFFFPQTLTLFHSSNTILSNIKKNKLMKTYVVLLLLVFLEIGCTRNVARDTSLVDQFPYVLHDTIVYTGTLLPLSLEDDSCTFIVSVAWLSSPVYSKMRSKINQALVPVPLGTVPGSYLCTLTRERDIRFIFLTVQDSEDQVKKKEQRKRIVLESHALAKRIVDSIYEKYQNSCALLDTVVFPLKKEYVTGEFGIRPVNQKQFRYHYGTDYRACVGTSVCSMSKGVIVLQEIIPMFGKTIIVNHGDNIFSFYLHLSSYRKHLGDTVFSGEYIAKSGKTGARKLSPHLHFGVSVERVPIDWNSFKEIFLTKRLAFKKPAFFILQNSVPWYSWVFSNCNLNTSRPAISRRPSRSSVRA